MLNKVLCALGLLFSVIFSKNTPAITVGLLDRYFEMFLNAWTLYAEDAIGELGINWIGKRHDDVYFSTNSHTVIAQLKYKWSV